MAQNNKFLAPNKIGYSFCAIGVFNEADTLESSLILNYSFQEQSIYTQKGMA
jgi:hypothetical protein